MWKIIIVLALGIALGYFKLIPEKVKKYSSAIQQIALLIMLFVLGAKIGLDKEILNNMGEIGLISFTLAFGSVLVSVLSLRYIIKPLLYHRISGEGDKKNDN